MGPILIHFYHCHRHGTSAIRLLVSVIGRTVFFTDLTRLPRVPNVSGGLVVSKVPQRTNHSLEYNVKLAQIAEGAGFDFALTQIRFLAGYGADEQHEVSTKNGMRWMQADRPVLARVSPSHMPSWQKPTACRSSPPSCPGPGTPLLPQRSWLAFTSTLEDGSPSTSFRVG